MDTNGFITSTGLLAVAWLPGLESWVQLAASASGISLLVWQVCYLHRQLQREREDHRRLIQTLIQTFNPSGTPKNNTIRPKTTNSPHK